AYDARLHLDVPVERRPRLVRSVEPEGCGAGAHAIASTVRLSSCTRLAVAARPARDDGSDTFTATGPSPSTHSRGTAIECRPISNSSREYATRSRGVRPRAVRSLPQLVVVRSVSRS